MWRLNSLVIFAILLSILNNCSFKEKELSVSLKPDMSIGVEEGDENYMFGGIADVEEDELENIYVLDYKFWTIKKYDKNGKFIRNIGKKGAGPGEIPQFTVDMDLKNGKIYLLLINMVIIYDTEGNYLKSFRVGIFPRFILVNSMGNIILVGADEATSKLFHVFDENGREISSFGEAFPAPDIKFKKISNSWNPISVLLTENKLFLANPFQYEIIVYKEGRIEKKLKWKSKNYEHPHIITDDGGSYIQGGIGGIFSFKNYLFVVLNTTKKERYVEVFEKENLTFKGASKIEVKGIPLSAFNGRIYFSNDDEFKITRYKIFIKE